MRPFVLVALVAGCLGAAAVAETAAAAPARIQAIAGPAPSLQPVRYMRRPFARRFYGRRFVSGYPRMTRHRRMGAPPMAGGVPVVPVSPPREPFHPAPLTGPRY